MRITWQLYLHYIEEICGISQHSISFVITLNGIVCKLSVTQVWSRLWPVMLRHACIWSVFYLLVTTVCQFVVVYHINVPHSALHPHAEKCSKFWCIIADLAVLSLHCLKNVKSLTKFALDPSKRIRGGREDSSLLDVMLDLDCLTLKVEALWSF